MNDEESGFSTPLAMTVLFSLSILVMALCMLVYASEKKIISAENNVEKLNEISVLIFQMEKEIQAFKDVKCDTEDSYEIKNILTCLNEYNYEVFDVSTGINRNFISRKILSDKAFENYLRSNGMEQDCKYSWINPEFAEEDVINEIQEEHEGIDLFPLINGFPLMNIYRMDNDLLMAVLAFYRISEPEKKVSAIRGMLGLETEIKDIAEVFEISTEHPLFNLVCTKTSFFEFRIEMGDYEVKAVFAAVPDKESKKKIDRYMLIDKSVLRKECAA